MKYYIAADGGGTKILSVLYDEDMNIIKTVKHRGSGITNDESETRAEINKALDELIPPHISEIEAFDYSIVAAGKIYKEALKARLPVKETAFYSEGQTPLAASGTLYGIVAQAGTGSDAFVCQPEESFAVGGWGYILGDEGSGYDIGLKSIKAAIYSFDGRGDKTVIEEMIWREWKVEKDFYDIVYKVMTPDFRKIISSVTKITSAAAAIGDKIAISIYENAGRELAHQVLTAIKRLGGKWMGPIITSGGAWKGSPHMRRAFDEAILAEYPDAKINYPDFEPVVGCVLMRRHLIGEDIARSKNKLKRSFSDFTYAKPE